MRIFAATDRRVNDSHAPRCAKTARPTHDPRGSGSRSAPTAKGVDVDELRGEADVSGPRVTAARTYEQALIAYFSCDFGGALVALEDQLDDGPSGVLAERCPTYLALPPPSE